MAVLPSFMLIYDLGEMRGIHNRNALFFGWLACWIFWTSHALTVFSSLGSERTKYGTILSVDISSKSEMQCFYETIAKGANMRIKVVVSIFIISPWGYIARSSFFFVVKQNVKINAMNAQSPELHMRLSSPSLDFSEWFHGRDTLAYRGTAEEDGIFLFIDF